MRRIVFTHTYEDITSLENLLYAWQEFIKGKRHRTDVQQFERQLMSKILQLHEELATKTYRHGQYKHFKISDPKPRDIHKAAVRDRLVHRALYRRLYPFFDSTFVTDSYSCRRGKGVHKASNTFRAFGYRVSENHTKTAWVLKCDIRKFFASIDHSTLLSLIEEYIRGKDLQWLIAEIVGSFHSTRTGIGLPLGNLTSQLFVNIYMNEFDQFVKHRLKAQCYVRYADDFVIVSQDKKWLENALPTIKDFLKSELQLELHPNKVSINTIASGVDFLGWVHFPDRRVLRTATKRRMLKNVKKDNLASYRGVLCHGNTKKLQDRISNIL